MHYNKQKVMSAIIALMCCVGAEAQDKIIHPDITYAGTPRDLVIGGFNVSGMDGYEDYMLTGISGLTIGQHITVPGNEITEAVKRYWNHGLFSDVQISADSIVGNKIYLHIALKPRPRVSQINYIGLKKSERDDMEQKLGILKGGQITPNMIDRAKILAKKYFDDKGFKNADIEIRQREDVTQKNQVILDIDIDKKEKMKVRDIIIEGNHQLKASKIKGGLFKKGAFAKTHEAGKLSSFLKSKKYTPERWKTDKEKLLEKYYELGFRDAAIISDSVWNVDPKHVNIYIKVEEGQKYYIRNIHWVGNTVYSSDYLQAVLGMKPHDVYNQKLLNKRLKEDDDAVGNLYYNHGYVFSNIDPIEQNITGDSIDLEMRVLEGPQAHLSHVRIYGNTRLYENVVRRELRTKPGDLFSKEALMRSYREIASMGYFDPEKINPDVKPDYESGTVNINWKLEQKSNDQIEFSLGWGQTGIIGRVGLTLNNFSMANLFRKNKEHRGIMPIGDGEKLSIGVQTNGKYYQSYNANYSTNWFGGKRPIQFSFGVYFSKQTDINSNYYNTAAMNNYYNQYLYGYNSYRYGYNNYTNYLDPDKYVELVGASLGWGKRLRWPDDFFTLSLELAYTRYMLKNWSYFLMSNGNANNLNLSISLNRSSTDNQLFPRSGSEFTASVTLTPPWSAWDHKDYKNLANNPYSPNYIREQQEKFRWIEYNKWKFKARTFTALTSAQKCFVLMSRAEIGLLGSYNKYKKSPFETYYVGGDGMSGYSSGYAEETVGLRGYENGSLAYNGYAYDRFTLELRYPFMLGNTTIYGLGFLEGGNAWSDVKNFNPFSMKRSAGIGVRIFLPMVGLMGIDWGYGFDRDNVNGRKGGSQFHFILGQEF
ncbi:MAG: outer membrane protein assembly factor BamA [Prevotella sp.]|nr:outer membrane protein assembly factor BamA [Prevotella sp.]